MSSNLLYRQFGCDAVLCPPGTFHPNGAASLDSGCRPCNITSSEDQSFAFVLGRTSCEGTTFIHGDLNGDGVLSEREILRMIYTYTIGKNWGSQFESWAVPSFNKCDLAGITCVEDNVAKIDLTDASLCSFGDRKAGPANECMGIPAEIAQLSKLEILMMNRRQFLRGTLPTEIGLLRSMKYLDVSNCPLLSGSLPSELGNMVNLR
jgi:Leucine-rich repeat (LRR) protein